MAVDELETTGSEMRNLATYSEIKRYCLEEYGQKVTTLYITQVKHKLGMPMRPNFNHSKKEEQRVPLCPPEKWKAIEMALEHFQMIEL